jgi:hypothetical protein
MAKPKKEKLRVGKAAEKAPTIESKKDQRLKKKEIKKQRCREKDYNTNEERSFHSLLSSLNLRIKYMDGDGNCMVRAHCRVSCIEFESAALYFVLCIPCNKLLPSFKLLLLLLFQFRSIADQLTGDPELHLNIRRRLMAYIDENRDHFSLFMEDDERFDDYLVRMK